MFFLVFGKTAQYEINDGTAIEFTTSFSEGDTFGEMAFFEATNRHSVSVKAVEFSEMEQLTFEDLAQLMQLYPDVAIQMQALAQDRAEAENSEQQGFKYVWSTNQNTPLQHTMRCLPFDLKRLVRQRRQ